MPDSWVSSKDDGDDKELLDATRNWMIHCLFNQHSSPEEPPRPQKIISRANVIDLSIHIM